jgi:hypothetical protein
MKRYIAISIGIVLLVAVIAGLFFLSKPGLIPTELSGGGVTMKNLQNDYRFTPESGGIPYGDFKSYTVGDTILFRDKIIDIFYASYDTSTGDEFPLALKGGNTYMFFEAYPLPSLDEVRSGRPPSSSWYRYINWGDSLVPATFFLMSGSTAAIPVKGDATSQLGMGDTVEITLHVEEGFGIAGEVTKEIYHFTLTPDQIHVVG